MIRNQSQQIVPLQSGKTGLCSTRPEEHNPVRFSTALQKRQGQQFEALWVFPFSEAKQLHILFKTKSSNLFNNKHFMEPLPHLLTTKIFYIFPVPFPHFDAIHCNWEEIYFLSPQLNSVLCRTAFGEAAPESGISRGACQESVTTCCKAGPKAALQGTAPGRVACLEFAGGEKRKTNIAADYAVKALAFTALLCRHIGSIRTFLKS